MSNKEIIIKTSQRTNKVCEVVITKGRNKVIYKGDKAIKIARMSVTNMKRLNSLIEALL